jgi:hypothetical protein
LRKLLICLRKNEDSDLKKIKMLFGMLPKLEKIDISVLTPVGFELRFTRNEIFSSLFKPAI